MVGHWWVLIILRIFSNETDKYNKLFKDRNKENPFIFKINMEQCISV